MTRPSTKCAVIVSSVTSTWLMRDSTLTAVLIPGLGNYLFVNNDKAPDLVQLSALNPEFHAIDTGASQNFASFRSRRTWTCIGSLQSKL
jgi:hypothetical protein